MVADEGAKFKAADTNGDGGLDVAEYSAFLHPQNYEHMHGLEIDRTLVDYDKNGDGVVTFEEYLGECTYTCAFLQVGFHSHILQVCHRYEFYCR